ncbi:hypothetical protein [Micromonospora sp. NPDC051296]|uniref:hypothetical protein n=1 Tax=Micromonospora sp. NPDC051296 TaxID=3155046 RepID=UPI00344A7789
MVMRRRLWAGAAPGMDSPSHPEAANAPNKVVLVRLTRGDLDATDDDALISACLAPVIARIRGRSFDVKSAEYGGLPPAQRALLAFHVLNGHAHELTSFWSHVRLFAIEWNVWSQLEDSARYFADNRLLEVYREISTAVHDGSDRDDGVAMALYTAYRAAVANSVRIAAEHIRTYPHRFVEAS